jgi:hypothetical protein
MKILWSFVGIVILANPAHAAAAALRAMPPYVNLGTVAAVEDLLDRQLPGSRAHFDLALTAKCPGSEGPCYSLADHDGVVKVTATGASELASGVGHYLRDYCNMSIGWERGGGSNLFIPTQWPKIGQPVMRRRNTPWSYMMNVCTHSYSLVWYSWTDWQDFLDWMALTGINLFLGMTGQEEIQYKVLLKFGLNDTEIRSWFNGPALLAWSRGQNEYGAGLGGPLPRSWMKQQWRMQQNITRRYRELGMSAQLPGFQGNVPVQLKAVQKDLNITVAGATGWLNSLDPLYAKIADEWMTTLIADFGTDHWYQLDGYLDGGTAPWLDGGTAPWLGAGRQQRQGLPTCVWGEKVPNTYSAGCPDGGCKKFSTVESAKAACVANQDCAAITEGGAGVAANTWTLRKGAVLKPSPETHPSSSYLITNAAACHKYAPTPTPAVADPSWLARGLQAYTGLNRTDPKAIWSFQGWSFVSWDSDKQRNQLKGFIDAAPKGRFNFIDMRAPWRDKGAPEWAKWENGTGLWGAKDNGRFIWTRVHDFGGTMALKGDLRKLNRIPFDAMNAKVQIWAQG